MQLVSHTELPRLLVKFKFSRFNEQADETGLAASTANVSLLQAEKELELLKKIGDFPKVISGAAKLRIPHRVATYIQELAATFHSFYNAEKVLDPENRDLSEARLALITATRTTIANALKLIGVSAPEKM